MDDLISRQQAIDKINERQRKLIYCFGFENDMVKIMDIAKSIITIMPSAQPEIIHCKDCKWYGRADKRRFYRGMDCLQKRIDTIVPDRDFCSKAERREQDG